MLCQLYPGGQQQGQKGYTTDNPGLADASKTRQGDRRPFSDVQPCYQRMDKLLRALLQVGIVSGAEAHGHGISQMGKNEIQKVEATS